MKRLNKGPFVSAIAVVVLSGAIAACGSGESSNRNRNSALPTTTVEGGSDTTLASDTTTPTDSTPTDSTPVTTSDQVALAQSTGKSGDEFGGAVVVSADGTTLAVGALQYASEQGAVTLFTRENGKWVEQQVLTDAEGTAKDWFGYSIALSANGSTVAIGSVYGDIDGKTDAGSVSVYTRDNGKWTLSKKLSASNGAAGDIFGVSVALSTDGTTLAVGASGFDSAVSNSGSVSVFVSSNGSWNEQQVLKPSKPIANQNFGASVSLSMNGDTLAVGGPNGGAGKAYVFARSNGAWS